MNRLVSISILILVTWGCAQKSLPTYDFPKPYETADLRISIQEKKVFADDSVVYADNLFDGARLNGFQRVNDTLFSVTITPENEPINPSPWYAFRIWSKKDTDVHLTFEYGKYKHRYYPKISTDGKSWNNLDSADVTILSKDAVFIHLGLLAGDTIWFAGQDVIPSTKVNSWLNDYSDSSKRKLTEIGKSKQGRPIIAMDVKECGDRDCPMLVVLSRQHPPEVTGYKAMQYFVDELLKGDELSRSFLQECRVLIVPVVNPDGVDMGHWRHGAGGVDLNRDWATYEQPETKVVAGYIYEQAQHNPVMMGIDFHSTYHDVFYTNDTLSAYPKLKTGCFEYMEAHIPNYKVNEKASPIERPVSKSWFFAAFGAEGITYEVGDDTPEDFIELKGRSAAQGVMKAYLENYLGR